MSTLSQKQEQDVTELLALIYNRVAWAKIKSRNPHDVFNHRLRAATSTANLNRFISKLGNYFGLQSMPVEIMEIIKRLRSAEQQVLNTLRMEHIAYTMLAVMRAKELREERKAKKDETLIEEKAK